MYESGNGDAPEILMMKSCDAPDLKCFSFKKTFQLREVSCSGGSFDASEDFIEYQF